MRAAHVLCSTFDQDSSQAIPTIQALINRGEQPPFRPHFSFSKLSKLSRSPLFFCNFGLCFLQLSFLLFFCFVHCSKQPISSSFAEKQQDKTRGIVSPSPLYFLQKFTQVLSLNSPSLFRVSVRKGRKREAASSLLPSLFHVSPPFIFVSQLKR
jgi:hypothetical protein